MPVRNLAWTSNGYYIHGQISILVLACLAFRRIRSAWDQAGRQEGPVANSIPIGSVWWAQAPVGSIRPQAGTGLGVCELLFCTRTSPRVVRGVVHNKTWRRFFVFSSFLFSVCLHIEALLLWYFGFRTRTRCPWSISNVPMKYFECGGVVCCFCGWVCDVARRGQKECYDCM